jgi:hypothetical protein
LNASISPSSALVCLLRAHIFFFATAAALQSSNPNITMPTCADPPSFHYAHPRQVTVCIMTLWASALPIDISLLKRPSIDIRQDAVNCFLCDRCHRLCAIGVSWWPISMVHPRLIDPADPATADDPIWIWYATASHLTFPRAVASIRVMHYYKYSFRSSSSAPTW